VVQIGAVDGPGPLVSALQTVVGGASTATGAASSAPSAGAQAGLTACLGPAAAQARVSPSATPVLKAELIYRDTPADAYVFRVGHQYVVAVVSEARCAPLAEVTF
jgi:hypothetical protein